MRILRNKYFIAYTLKIYVLLYCCAGRCECEANGCQKERYSKNQLSDKGLSIVLKGRSIAGMMMLLYLITAIRNAMMIRP